MTNNDKEQLLNKTINQLRLAEQEECHCISDTFKKYEKIAGLRKLIKQLEK